jgi:hypothetical protein
LLMNLNIGTRRDHNVHIHTSNNCVSHVERVIEGDV